LYKQQHITSEPRRQTVEMYTFPVYRDLQRYLLSSYSIFQFHNSFYTYNVPYALCFP